MPTVQLADVTLNYRFDGSASAPVLVLAHSLGSDLHMWDDQLPAFAEHFRVLRYDSRGHGESSVPPGPYRIEQLGGDVLGLVDALGIDQFSFCGLSMGGVIGQWLGIHAGERLQGLVLCSTGAKIGDEETWNERIEKVKRGREQAMGEMREGAIGRWFTAGFAEHNPLTVGRITDTIARTAVDGYVASCAAVRDADFRQALGAIAVPTLVVCGAHDPVTTLAHAQFIQAQIPDAELAVLEASHLPNVEAAEAYNRRVLAFLRS